jgi:hypothetical protein
MIQQTLFDRATPSEQFGAVTGPLFEAALANYTPTNPWAGEQSPQITGEQVQRTQDATNAAAEAYPLWARDRARNPIDLLGDAFELSDPTPGPLGPLEFARDWADRTPQIDWLKAMGGNLDAQRAAGAARDWYDKRKKKPILGGVH